MNKKCGTCYWSEPIPINSEHLVTVGPKRVSCVWEVTHSIPSSIIAYSTFMYEHEGTHCPCWKKKREENETMVETCSSIQKEPY